MQKIAIFAMLCLFFLISIAGCTGGIPKDQYSPLSTPQESFEFAQKSIAMDDPEAFYYCLAEGTRRQVPLSDVKLAWALAGSFFYIFLDARMKHILTPAPEYEKSVIAMDTSKVTIESHGIEASFLLHCEDKQWKLCYPSPYPLPDISKIKRQERTPWRMETYLSYQDNPERWYRPPKIEREYIPSTPRKPKWRTE